MFILWSYWGDRASKLLRLDLVYKEQSSALSSYYARSPRKGWNHNDLLCASYLTFLQEIISMAWTRNLLITWHQLFQYAMTQTRDLVYDVINQARCWHWIVIGLGPKSKLILACRGGFRGGRGPSEPPSPLYIYKAKSDFYFYILYFAFPWHSPKSIA